MNLEKRSSGEPSKESQEKTGGNKPVVVYIMILFIAAFLLMALSFAMHQRSNTQALGELQNSVTVMQDIQASQERIIELQQELADLEDQLAEKDAEQETLNQKLKDAGASLDSLEQQLAAQSHLYTLMQQYAARDYDACAQTLQQMEANGWPALLGDVPPEAGVTPPSQRYEELKEAVEAKLDK